MPGRVRVAARLARTEVARAPLSHKILVAVSLLGLVWEWGPMNEAVISNVSVWVLHRFGTGYASTFKAGVVASTYSFVSQALFGTIMAINIGRFPATFLAVAPKNDRTTSLADRSIVRQIVVAFSVGAVGSLLYESVITGGLQPARARRLALRSAALVSVSVFFVVGAFGALVVLLTRRGHPRLADGILAVVSNPFLWLGLFGLIVVSDSRSSRRVALIERRCTSGKD